MPTAKTIGPEEVWKSIHQLSIEIREMKKTLFKAFAATDREQKKTDEQMKKTDEKMKETAEQMKKDSDRRWEEAKKQSKETDKQIKETHRSLEIEGKKLKKTIDNLTGKWGLLVESLISPGTVAVFQKRGIPINGMAQRVKRARGGDNMEIDVLLHNGDTVVAIEIKSTLGPDDIQDFIDTLTRFKEFFPEYADKKVLGAVAGIAFSAGSSRHAYKKGLFVLVHHGESIKILNDAKFCPKPW